MTTVLSFFSPSLPKAKNGEPLHEEKDTTAFDNVEKGGQQPLNPPNPEGGSAKATPDKKSEGGAAAAAAAAGGAAAAAPAKGQEGQGDSEDKKSNGAHTPV